MTGQHESAQCLCNPVETSHFIALIEIQAFNSINKKEFDFIFFLNQSWMSIYSQAKFFQIPNYYLLLSRWTFILIVCLSATEIFFSWLKYMCLPSQGAKCYALFHNTYFLHIYLYTSGSCPVQPVPFCWPPSSKRNKMPCSYIVL